MWDPRYEAMPRDELQALQLERARKTVELAYASVPFYRASFDGAGVRPEQLRTLDDLRRFPFIRKLDFREGYPWSLLAVPRERIREVHASSGTTGSLSPPGSTPADPTRRRGLGPPGFAAAGARRGPTGP